MAAAPSAAAGNDPFLRLDQRSDDKPQAATAKQAIRPSRSNTSVHVAAAPPRRARRNTVLAGLTSRPEPALSVRRATLPVVASVTVRGIGEAAPEETGMNDDRNGDSRIAIAFGYADASSPAEYPGGSGSGDDTFGYSQTDLADGDAAATLTGGARCRPRRRRWRGI